MYSKAFLFVLYFRKAIIFSLSLASDSSLSVLRSFVFFSSVKSVRNSLSNVRLVCLSFSVEALPSISIYQFQESMLLKFHMLLQVYLCYAVEENKWYQSDDALMILLKNMLKMSSIVFKQV